MYIPQPTNPKATSQGKEQPLLNAHPYTTKSHEDEVNRVPWSHKALDDVAPIEIALNLKGASENAITARQFSNNPMNNTNIKIGIALGFVLGIFLIGLFAFLWTYRYSVRCTSKRKSTKCRGSSSSKSSQSSRSSQSSSGGDDAPEEAEASGAAEGDGEAGDGDGEAEEKKDGE